MTMIRINQLASKVFSDWLQQRGCDSRNIDLGARAGDIFIYEMIVICNYSL